MFRLSIVTPEQVFYEGEVSSMIIPGSEGYLGVLTDHAPLITAVIPGKLTIKDESMQEIILSVTYGFFEISSNTASLLVDAVEYAGRIDLEKARRALERAQQRLTEGPSGMVDSARARRALERAKSRIRIVQEEDTE
ncbi:MAG: ATP synthase F1 subunit epsilon [candidate division Zixibacteria bacterium]|jgi:F-type H+-transporting ATPase subunit epsilon|nr:ATP synthase F1 subunit epsilon [candidate division Zixibacteria bacterium]